MPVAGLLNAIDGVAAQEGRMLFMTTNHMERLDAALIRPGRVDMRLEFAHANEDQIMDFFVGFYQVRSLPPTLTAVSAAQIGRSPPSELSGMGSEVWYTF